MQQTFEITRSSRKILSQFLETHTLEQLNTIPEGFNNNLIWNIAHIIVVQQMLVYRLAGLPMIISDQMVEKYKKGTKPEHQVTEAEVTEIKGLIFKTIDQTRVDFDKKLFANFSEYPTSTGFVIKNILDAMAFNYFHEALHLGVIMTLKKLI